MNFKNLHFDYFKKDALNFSVESSDTYISSYKYFLNYFNQINVIKTEHLVISSHFVYGWMPTIVNLDLSEINLVLDSLNKAKNGFQLSEIELEAIKKCINNSMVGSSKLLHFINPNIYAIWDSRIMRYATSKKSIYGISEPKNYIGYLNCIHEISNHKEYPRLHSHIEGNFDYSLSKPRAIEIVMFESDKRNQKQLKTKIQ